VHRRALPLLFTAACLVPAPAAADWLLSPYVGWRFGADTTFVVGGLASERNKFTWGTSFGLLTDRGFGVEADFAWIPGAFEDDLGVITPRSRVISLMGNVILATPLGVASYGLRPYLVGGVGLLHAVGGTEFSNVVDSDLFGVDIGGGAIGPLTPRTSARFDLRFFRNLTNDESAAVIAGGAQLSFWRGTVGLTFRF
jgi:Outer membrane protein beta-barrel domain